MAAGHYGTIKVILLYLIVCRHKEGKRDLSWIHYNTNNRMIIIAKSIVLYVHSCMRKVIESCMEQNNLQKGNASWLNVTLSSAE